MDGLAATPVPPSGGPASCGSQTACKVSRAWATLRGGGGWGSSPTQGSQEQLPAKGGGGRGGHTGLEPPHFVTMGESLSLPGCFCPKSLVPERLQAGNLDLGVWDDVRGSRLNCDLLQGMSPQCLAQCWLIAGARYACVNC